VGGIEAMLDDSVSYVKKAVEAGVLAKVHIWRGMPHVFSLYGFMPETVPARNAVVEWLTSVGGNPEPAKNAPYRSVVEVFDKVAFTGRLDRETNDVYLAG
jgi:hypothetical protein